MAKKKRKPRRSGAAAIQTMTLAQHDGPSFSVDATVCLSASLYNVREKVMELALERACGMDPVPTTAVVLALSEMGLNWATEVDDGK